MVSPIPSLQYLEYGLKHILGTCAAEYNIKWTRLSPPTSYFAFDRVTISGGQFITGGASFAVGKKDKPLFISHRDDYIQKVNWISKKFVVLYDVGVKRAWLSNGLSALLHLVITSIKHNQTGIMRDILKFSLDQLKESGNPFGGKEAAWNILIDPQNLRQPLYTKPCETTTEETSKESGRQEVTLKSVTSEFTFKDQVSQIYHILEQIIAHQANTAFEDGVGFRVRRSPRRQLEGFNFMDVATDEDPILPVSTNIESAGWCWVDFLRGIDAITLFGSDFGPLIRPMNISLTDCRCLANRDVPVGSNYLAVCVSDLEAILSKRDRAAHPRRLVDKVCWHSPEVTFVPCQCSMGNEKNPAERTQVLVPESFLSVFDKGLRSPEDLPPQGAVLFGKNRNFPLRWFDHGDPEKEEIEPAPDRGRNPRLNCSKITKNGRPHNGKFKKTATRSDWPAQAMLIY